jgi:hypothetical protein
MIFDVKKIAEPRKSIIIDMVKKENIPSISNKTNIARRLAAKKGDLLVIEGVGLDLDYSIKMMNKRALLAKIMKVI